MKPTDKSFKRYSVYATLLVMLGAFIYFALLADAFYSAGDVQVRPTIAQLSPSLPVDIREKDEERINITRPINGINSREQRVEVEGRAPHNSVVALYVNGALTENSVARNGYYHFSKVQLTKHANVLQTRFYAKNGFSDSSSAILVFYQKRIVSAEDQANYFRNSSDNLSRGNLNKKQIVMTFNGTLKSDSCETILKALDDAKVQTTMFLSAEFLGRYPGLSKKIAERQEVGPYVLSASSHNELHSELYKTEREFQQLTGKRLSKLWRGPFTASNLELRKWAAELGYVHVAWTNDSQTRQNMDSMDTIPNADSPEYFPALLIKDRLLSFGQNEPQQANGAIVMMNLGSDRESGDRLAPWLPEIIMTLQRRGYQFVTAGQILKSQQS
jgi:peptidoglycan/xylan/chitin deacetylase (PgdA/CDA1 family)